MKCGNCSKDATKIKTVYDEKLGKSHDSCNHCGGVSIGDFGCRDAHGNRVKVPTDRIGTYSYATDSVIKSTRRWAEELKEHGLHQK